MSEKNILERFHEEVLATGLETTLPANLSDYWLKEIQGKIERYFAESEGAEGNPEEDNMSLPLAAILHILFAKNNGQQIEASMEEMFKYFQDYRIELALEEVRRKTDIKAEPATIASIFTGRDVTISEA